MTKEDKRILVPLSILTIMLLYCWSIILFTDTFATWQHYLGLVLYLPLLFLFFKRSTFTAVGTGIYLLLGTFNLLAITPTVNTSWLTIFSVPTPPVQLIFLALFILYFVLNLDVLINLYLDLQERKAEKK